MSAIRIRRAAGLLLLWISLILLAWGYWPTPTATAQVVLPAQALEGFSDGPVTLETPVTPVTIEESKAGLTLEWPTWISRRSRS